MKRAQGAFLRAAAGHRDRKAQSETARGSPIICAAGTAEQLPDFVRRRASDEGHARLRVADANSYQHPMNEIREIRILHRLLVRTLWILARIDALDERLQATVTELLPQGCILALDPAACVRDRRMRQLATGSVRSLLNCCWETT